MKKIFRKNLDYILFIFTVFLFVFICGYSEAGIKKIPDLPNSATIQNNDLLVFENVATNKTNNIKFSDLVLNFPVSNIYAQDGSLASDRTVNGNGNQLTFDSNNGFYVSNNSGDLSLNGSTAAIYTSTGNINISPFGNLILDNIQNNNSADRVLAQDSATGATQFIDVSALSGNIYNVDGTLTSNRILDGDSWNQGINFGELAYFNVYATNFYSESQAGNTIENGATGIDLQAMGTGQTLTLQGDIVNLGGVTDTYFSFLNQDDTQNKVLVLDGSDKLFWRDASSLSSNIYTADGTLLSNRVLNGDNYSFDLSMTQISSFGVEANELSLYSNGIGTLEANGNLNLLANENLTGGVAKNTDLRSIPDWDLTGDLSGRLYSGNDVLDIFSLLGGNIRGTGFFNKRTSNGISHYIFGGDTTGIGGVPDNIALGITDFGLTNFITEFELVRDDGFGNGSYRVEVANPTSYYSFNVKNEGQLLETFANTGFTSERSTDINNSFYDYLSNNHHYSLKFEEAGGQYLELHNQDTLGPENSYTRMFRTNIQSSVSDGILSNGTTLSLTGFNVLNLNDYSGGEKVLVHDSSGDIRKSIEIDSFQIRKNINIVSANTTASKNDLVVYQGGNLGAPFTHTITLPAGTDKDEITVKVYSNDVLRVDVIGGGLIDGSTFIDIDGTIASKPSVTFVYSLLLGSWIII